MPDRIIVYSHGFGVRKDDRGLFTDIAAAIPDARHVMFDYNIYDDAANTSTVVSLENQAAKLAEQLDMVRAENPDAIVDLICHSQGCVVAALLKPLDVRKATFLAPPPNLSPDRLLKIFEGREGVHIDREGISRFPRRDGTTTIIPATYWKSIMAIDPIVVYNELAAVTEVVIISANQDEVLGKTNFSGLSKSINIITLDAGHDFKPPARQQMIDNIKQEPQ